MEMRPNKQFEALDAWLKQTEVGWRTQPGPVASLAMPMDNAMPTSDSPMSAPESDLSLAAQLAAANPTQQNVKLISQALSAMPLALKLFQPKDAAASLEEEQRVIVDQGLVIVQSSQ